VNFFCLTESNPSTFSKYCLKSAVKTVTGSICEIQTSYPNETPPASVARVAPLGSFNKGQALLIRELFS